MTGDSRLESSPPAPGTGERTSLNQYKSPSARELHTLSPDGSPPDQQPRWRMDFPIDWPQDHYVARRDFTKALAGPQSRLRSASVWAAARGRISRLKMSTSRRTIS